MGDKRTDSGQFYPGGRVIARPGKAPQQVVVQWSDVQNKPQVAPLPERYRDSDMKNKINEIASKFATAIAVALIGWTALAGLVVQKAQKDQIWNDEEIVTNAYLTGENASGAARILPKYLWLYEANDSYPDEAAEYYRLRGTGEVGGCSAVRDGGFLYRNFDFPFDDRAEFIVRMSAGPGRLASVGVAQVGTNLTEKMVTSGSPEYSARYKWLPGATVDGINEHGVVAEINVVDGDPQTSGWRTNETDSAVHPLGAVRWVLDHATNAEHAAQYVAENIRFPKGWTQNFHYMIADAEQTWIVENGSTMNFYVEYEEWAVLTNFRYIQYSPGEGMERYNLLLGGASITNAWYTKAYRRETNPPWVSDLRDVIAYTNEIFNAWAAHPKEYFRGKTTDGQPWWQTVHTSVYDISNRVLRVAVQETDDWYTFQVPSAGGGVKVETDPTVPTWAKRPTPPEGMTENALVWTNGVVKTKDGGKTIAAGDVGAYSKAQSDERYMIPDYKDDDIYTFFNKIILLSNGGGLYVDASNPDKKIAVRQGGTYDVCLAKTSDGGLSWEEYELPEDGGILATSNMIESVVAETGRAITASAAAAGTNYTDTVASLKADKTNTYTMAAADGTFVAKRDVEQALVSSIYPVSGSGVLSHLQANYTKSADIARDYLLKSDATAYAEKAALATATNALDAAKRGKTDLDVYGPAWDFTPFVTAMPTFPSDGVHVYPCALEPNDWFWAVLPKGSTTLNDVIAFDSSREYLSLAAALADDITSFRANKVREGSQWEPIRNVTIHKTAIGPTGDRIAALSDIPAEVEVIDPASATSTGKAADALKTKQSLAAKVDSADLDGYVPWANTNRNAVTVGSRGDGAVGARSLANGYDVVASGTASHAEGLWTNATGPYSHAEGVAAVAAGDYAHAEGQNSEANGEYSHAEGNGTEANGDGSHAEGATSVAAGEASHAEGQYTEANGEYSHAEGNGTEANGYGSHAEGVGTYANGYGSHAEGYSSMAVGAYSVAIGKNARTEDSSGVENDYAFTWQGVDGSGLYYSHGPGTFNLNPVGGISGLWVGERTMDAIIEQRVSQLVSARLNTYVDGETGVEYVGKFYDGSLYYVPTGNVYPPNN